MESNRLISFVEDLNKEQIKSWDIIFKRLNLTFGSKFFLNRTEADYLTMYYNGQLKFNVQIINL